MKTIVPSGEFRFIALDVETSCHDSASICQIGLACVGTDHSIQTYTTLVNPQLPFARFNVDLHGIGPDTVRNAPTFPQIWPRLMPLLSRHPLIQHSRFDEKAVAAACKLHEISEPKLQWSDSVKIARKAWPELKGNGGHGLANLRDFLGFEFKHHDAGEDARAAALVVLHAEQTMGQSLAQITGRQHGFQLSFQF